MGSQRVGCNLHFPFHLGSPNIAWTWFLICFINAKLFNFSFYPFFLNDIACKCSITTTCFPDHDLKKFLIFRLYIFLLKLWQVANCKLQSKHWNNCLHIYLWEWCHSPDHTCCFPRITKEQGNSHVPLMNTWRISSWWPMDAATVSPFPAIRAVVEGLRIRLSLKSQSCRYSHSYSVVWLLQGYVSRIVTK